MFCKEFSDCPKNNVPSANGSNSLHPKGYAEENPVCEYAIGQGYLRKKVDLVKMQIGGLADYISN